MKLLLGSKKINCRDLRAQFDSLGQQVFYGYFMEAVDEGLIDLSQISIRDLAESFLGDSWNKSFRDVARGGLGMVHMEAGTPVTTSAFRNITGQLIFSTIRRWFQNEAFVFSGMIPTIQSRIEGTEKVPSIARIGDASEIVIEGQDYPTVGFGEEYFTWAAKDKRGLIVDLTEEAIFYDLTNLVLEAAREVGLWLGTKKEKLLIDVFVGQTNNYSRNGTATNTYLTTGAYVNDATGAGLNDWTSVEAAELAFNDVLDPNTSEPIELLDTEAVLVVTPYKKHTARRIVSATEVRERSETGAATRENEMVSANPIANYRTVSSKQLYRRILAGPEPVAANAREWWWLGAPSRAFAWLENFPLRVFQQTDGDRAFEADIVARFKASMKGVAQVVEPRYMQRRRVG